MQLTERIPDCNGCGTCVLGCKYFCVKMEKTDIGCRPVVNEDGCQKCNNCILYCPLFMPVDMPEFDRYYEYNPEYDNRDMPEIYRQTLRQAKTGAMTNFVGTLCEIAGLISLMGDKLKPNVNVYPIHCDQNNPKRPACEACTLIKR